MRFQNFAIVSQSFQLAASTLAIIQSWRTEAIRPVK